MLVDKHFRICIITTQFVAPAVAQPFDFPFAYARNTFYP
jgi:hypothetical protein